MDEPSAKPNAVRPGDVRTVAAAVMALDTGESR